MDGKIDISQSHTHTHTKQRWMDGQVNYEACMKMQKRRTERNRGNEEEKTNAHIYFPLAVFIKQ